MILTLISSIASCSSGEQATSSPTPTTVDPAEPEQATGEFTVRVGTIVNTAAPTVELDRRLTEVMRQAADSRSSGAAVSIEVMTIDGFEDIESSVSALAGRGVTVIAALCDDATVPGIVEAAVNQGILAVTACVSLPTPTLTSDSPMFIDLAGMHDSGEVIARWASEQDVSGLATIQSDLLADVEESCTSVQSSLASVDVSLDLSLTFTELVDDPTTVIDDSRALLETTDAIVVCALPPAAGDMVSTLRSNGLDQPIIVPWFADTQRWPITTSDVFVVAPASRHGDDPTSAVVDLFDVIGASAQAADVVTADSIAMLSNAALTARSTGSSRLAEQLRAGSVMAVSGELSVDDDSRVSGRDYRVIGVTRGAESFDGLVAARR